MAHKNLAFPIRLTPRQSNLLAIEAKKTNLPPRKSHRIKIILLAYQGHSNISIAQTLGISRDTVRHWRKVWVQAYEGLCAWESKQKSDGALLGKMQEILEDAPRSGAPLQISQAEKESLVSLACKKPKDFDIPLPRWTSELLAQVAQQQGLVEKISPRYVREILKKT